MSLPEPNFIDRDPQAITADLVAQYEQLSGKTLYPGQVERVFIDVLAYRETLVRVGIQSAAKQNLLAFSSAPILDYLGEIVGVTRLPAQPALCTLRFSVATALDIDLLVPVGTRVESSDGSVSFATNADAVLAVGALTVDVSATCETPGQVGNGWQPGQLTSLVDQLSSVDVSAANVNVAANGADEEGDDALRDRIRLAPEAFSTAGSRLAYEFWAKSAHQSIIDAKALSLTGGLVTIYVLTAAGLPDANLLALVEATCSGERVRPLNDTVQALAPAAVDYEINAALTLYSGVDADMALAAAQAAAQAYVADRAAGLGRDIVPRQIIRALMVDGVYDVDLAAPADSVLDVGQWARCTAINVTLAGVSDG